MTTVKSITLAALATLALAGCGNPFPSPYQAQFNENTEACHAGQQSACDRAIQLQQLDLQRRMAIVGTLQQMRPPQPIYFAPCTVYAQIAHQC